MARVKITALPETASLKGTDLITAVADFVNYKVQVQNLGNSMTVGQASTASFITASGVYGPQGSNSVLNASNAGTASFITASGVYGPYGSNSVSTASYALTASYVIGGASTINIQEEGGAVVSAGTINFVGGGVTATDGGGGTATITIPGAGAGSGFPYTGSAVISGSLSIIESGSIGLVVTGSVVSTVGFTGSLQGTASFVTASSVWGPFGSNSVISASYAVTASNSLTASYAQAAVSIVGISNPIIQGNGTTNYVAKFTPNGTSLGNSSIQDNGSLVSVINNTLITGSLVTSGSNGAGIFSQGGNLIDYAVGVSNSGSLYMVWRAPFSCSVVAMYGFREGGGPSKVNAVRSGSSGFDLLSGSDLSLTSSNVWTPFNSVQNADFNSGDSLKLIMSGSASNSQLAVQVDFIRKF